MLTVVENPIDESWSCVRLNDGLNIKQVDVFKLVGIGLSLVCCLIIWGTTCGFLFLQFKVVSGVVSHPRELRESQYVLSAESSSLTHHKSYS